MSYHRWVFRLTVALLVGFVAVAGPAAPARADAALVSSDPAPGAVLTTVPEAVTFTFNEALQGRFTTVTVNGGAVAVPAASTTGATVSQPLPATLAPGGYTVAYRVVSADGHPISGQVSFTVSAPRSTAPVSQSPAGAAAPTAVDGASGPWIWLVPAAVVVGIGAVLLIGRRRRPVAG